MRLPLQLTRSSYVMSESENTQYPQNNTWYFNCVSERSVLRLPHPGRCVHGGGGGLAGGVRVAGRLGDAGRPPLP